MRYSKSDTNRALLFVALWNSGGMGERESSPPFRPSVIYCAADNAQSVWELANEKKGQTRLGK